MLQNIQNMTNLSILFLNSLSYSAFKVLNIHKYKLYELAKHYKISKYKKLAKWCLASLLLKQNDINTMIYKIMLRDRVVKDEKITDFFTISKNYFNNSYLNNFFSSSSE